VDDGDKRVDVGAENASTWRASSSCRVAPSGGVGASMSAAAIRDRARRSRLSVAGRLMPSRSVTSTDVQRSTSRRISAAR